MARRFRSKRRGGRRAKSIPVAVMAPLAGQAYMSAVSAGPIQNKVNNFTIATTGVDFINNKISMKEAVPFWTAMLAGVIVHKASNKFGVNNYVRRATGGYLSL